jgi:hypothetical protein
VTDDFQAPRRRRLRTLAGYEQHLKMGSSRRGGRKRYAANAARTGAPVDARSPPGRRRPYGDHNCCSGLRSYLGAAAGRQPRSTSKAPLSFSVLTRKSVISSSPLRIIPARGSTSETGRLTTR